MRVNWGVPPFQDIDSVCFEVQHVDVTRNECVDGTVSRCFDSCSVPGLIPDATVEIIARAIVENKLFTNVVEFGTATVDPNHAVFDPSTQNNVITIPH